MNNRGIDFQDEKNVTLLEHIEELRKRIIYVILFFTLTLGIGVYFAKDIFFLIIDNNNLNINVYQFSPGDGLLIYIKIALLIGFLLTVPFTLYQIWMFCSPALNSKQRSVIFLYIPVSFFLLIFGVLFAYYGLLPRVMFFILAISSTLKLEDMFGVIEYTNFILRFVFLVSIMFILPVLIVFLTHINVITPFWLKKMRKYIYLLLLIISALITPPDLITAILVALPFIFLFEISVSVSKIVHKRIVKESEYYD